MIWAVAIAFVLGILAGIALVLVAANTQGPRF